MHRDDSTLLNHKGILYKLALVVLLVVGGGNSAWADKSLPYSYGFENNNLATDGWTTVNPNTGSLKTGIFYATTAYTHSGSYHFRFISYEVDAQYLISPALANTTSGIEVSFYYRTYGNSDTEKFYVGYSSTDNSISNFTWSTEESYASSTYTSKTWSFPAGTKYVAIKTTTNTANTYRYLFIDDITIVDTNPYKTPTSFALSSYDATSATFSWTAGNSETTWQFDYSTNPDFTPGTGINGTNVSITSNPYTLSGLTTGTTYYASIRADYGSGYSEWTDKVSFTPRTEVETTINDGNGTSSYIPFYGSGGNSTSNASQFILPSSQLSDISGRQITKIVLHTTSSYASRNWGVAEWEVYMSEVGVSSFSTLSLMAFGTKVFNAATLSVSNQELSITLDTPFNYNGGNLLIGFKTTKAGTSNWCTFYGVSASSGTNNGLYGTSTLYYQSFYPKMTITSVPITADPVQMGENGYTTYASPRALDLTNANLPSGLKAYKASIIDGSWVRFTEIDDEVVANTGILLEGTANTTYNIPLADSGNDISDSNLLLVNVDGDTFTGADGYTYYAIKKNSDPLVFATFNPSSVAIPSNKAYLKVSDVQAHSLSCMFDDESSTTGVETMFNEQSETNSKIYNLQGQRVTAPQKGLYIVNGKKFINK